MYYFVTYLFILISAKGSFLYFSNIWWFFTDIMLIWVGLEKQRFGKKDIRLLVIFSSIYIGFCTFRSLFLVHLPFSYWLSDVEFLFKFILTSFLFCAVLKDKAIYYVTRVIIQLAIISIPLYFLQLISGNLVWTIGTTINLPPHFVNLQYTNFLVFTYVKQHAIRNSGFSWEPGSYGFFLCMGLLLHLLTNGFTFDKNARWLALAIITTISTTSYLALLVIIFLYYRARGVKLSKLVILLVPVLCILAIELPFLFDKINYVYNRDNEDINNIEFLSKWYLQRGAQMPLNRFGSALYLYQLFGVNLIWGISNIYVEAVPILKTINLSNGIFQFMAMYGLIGLGYFFNRCFDLFRKYTKSIELSIYGLLVILVLGFSESIFTISFTMCFFFLYFYSEPEEILDEQPEETAKTLPINTKTLHIRPNRFLSNSEN
jgi:hypothetical protein